MRKENICYEKNKNKRESIPAWKNKRPNNYDPKKKQNKFHKNLGDNYRGYQGNHYKKFKPQNPAIKEPSNIPNKNFAQNESLKGWECGGLHYFKDCQARENNFNLHSLQEAVIVRDMAKSMPIICTALENRQAEH